MINKASISVLVLCLLPFLVLTAQQSIIVLSTNGSGGIVYQSTQNQTQRVFPGLRLAPQGKLIVDMGRRVNLVADGKKITISGPDEVDMSAIALRAENSRNTTFVSRFWNFISSSMTNIGSADDVEKYHRKHITNTKAGIAGFTDRNYPIQLPFYFGGEVGDQDLNLSWTALEGASAYRVTLLKVKEQTAVLAATTRTNHLRISTAELALEPGTAYQLSVTASQGEEVVSSPPVSFHYSPEGAAEITVSIREKRAYQLLEPEEQPLYLILALEEENYFAAAQTAYVELLADDPNNRFYRQFYAAFLARMNDPEAAKAMIEPNPSKE
jgi:hypothetical protein